MKTAEEYIVKDILLFDMADNIRLRVGKIINESRKDAIEECARVAELKILKRNGVRQVNTVDVDRVKILSLINELK